MAPTITLANVFNTTLETAALGRGPSVQDFRIKFIKSHKYSTKFQNKPTASDDSSKKPLAKDGETNCFEIYPRKKVQLKWRQINSVGPGLQNSGQTCYLNSVLQNLIYCAPLANYSQTDHHTSMCRIPDCLLCQFQKFSQQCLKSKQRVTYPTFLIKRLKEIGNFSRNRQEDAHEFKTRLLHKLHDCCLKLVDRATAKDYEYTTPIYQIFGGVEESIIKCSQCGHVSASEFPFMDVCVDIVSGVDSLQTGLKNYTKTGILRGSSSYRCEKCKKLVTAERSVGFKEGPAVLTVVFKRFEFFGRGKKISKKINFPPSFDLGSVNAKTQPYRPMKYSLTGVVVHDGRSCFSGHYRAFIKNSNGTWYSMNDTMIQQVSLSTVLKQEAYMLFYTRDEDIPFTAAVLPTPDVSPRSSPVIQPQQTPFVKPLLPNPSSIIPYTYAEQSKINVMKSSANSKQAQAEDVGVTLNRDLVKIEKKKDKKKSKKKKMNSEKRKELLTTTEKILSGKMTIGAANSNSFDTSSNKGESDGPKHVDNRKPPKLSNDNASSSHQPLPQISAPKELPNSRNQSAVNSSQSTPSSSFNQPISQNTTVTDELTTKKSKKNKRKRKSLSWTVKDAESNGTATQVEETEMVERSQPVKRTKLGESLSQKAIVVHMNDSFDRKKEKFNQLVQLEQEIIPLRETQPTPEYPFNGPSRKLIASFIQNHPLISNLSSLCSAPEATEER
ncbi:hypothetical protein BKA69DRAFT_1045570 [Paraphysoderma sedebokerense]|nr:hypothetical protein BKA69DRAFT_1045570 [Paraphysoderma sedebokerense]